MKTESKIQMRRGEMRSWWVDMLARYFVRLNLSIQIFRSVAAPVFGEIERLVGLGDPFVN